MGNFTTDQAEGLRRLLGSSKGRVFTFVSASARAEKSALLTNLAASLVKTGSDVALIDACYASTSVIARMVQKKSLSIWDAANLDSTGQSALLRVPQPWGYDVAFLGLPDEVDKKADLYKRAQQCFSDICTVKNVVLVDAQLDNNGELPIPALAQGDIALIVSVDPKAITLGFKLIKTLSETYGRRPFGLLVTGAEEAAANVVFEKMAEAATKKLAVSVYSLGSIPTDEHVVRAASLGRTVFDAFPMASASVALRRLTGQFAAPSLPGIAKQNDPSVIGN